MPNKITSTIAKSENGNVQITFSIPFALVKEEREKALRTLGESLELPGFRKGKAPLKKVAEHTAKETLIQKTLEGLLPKTVADAIVEYKIRPAIYPRLEVLKAPEDEDWQVRALTCELPQVSLGNYKEAIKGAARSKAIWTPDKGKDVAKKEPSREEKEQETLKILLSAIKVNIPNLLIDEEVNTRLSGLLEKIEKLGLTLDGYLGSIGKTPESLREEYKKRAEEAIALDLILDKIAEEEKIKVEETQIEEVIKVSSADPKMAEKLNSPEQRRLIASILRRRACLDSLIALL